MLSVVGDTPSSFPVVPGNANDDKYLYHSTVNSHEGELDSVAAGFSFKERTVHFLQGEKMFIVKHPVVEIALLTDNGTYVNDQETTAHVNKFEMLKTRYLQVIDDFDDSNSKSCQVCLQMKTYINRTQYILDGERMCLDGERILNQYKTFGTNFAL